MDEMTLESMAGALVAPGMGMLAADESLPTIDRRLREAGVSSTEETRRAYREMLFTAPGIEDSISGVILFDETIRQETRSGVPFPKLLQTRGMVPGIKVDRGAKPLSGFPEETVTEGLDGLRERLTEYRALGARFTKWRAVIRIGDGIPTPLCIRANAHALARFAALSQEARLVPLAEPEVLMEGDHSIDECFEATVWMLRRLFEGLADHRVNLMGMLLKTNMVLAGKDHSTPSDIRQTAEATIRCLRQTVPPAVPGVVFLSGGQDPKLATRHLDAINRLGPQPWQLSFSFARALQDPALRTWRGDAARASVAQELLVHRARCNGAARAGQYSTDMESVTAPA
jgi:fructose-bisphosphate aldolase, class I